MVYVDWVDLDDTKMSIGEMETFVKESGQVDFLVREDVFDRYEDGRVIRRVYLTKPWEGASQVNN
jgi:hypothetical protein